MNIVIGPEIPEIVKAKIPWSYTCFKCKRYPFRCGKFDVCKPGNEQDAKPVVDYPKLPLMLQKRFLELSNLFIQSKLQCVCKSMYVELKQQEILKQISRFVMDPNCEFKYETESINISPTDLDHQTLKNNVILKRFTARNINEGDIQKLIDRDNYFFIKSLVIEHSELTLNEFKCLTSSGYLRSIVCRNVKITPLPSMDELSMILEPVVEAQIYFSNWYPENDWGEFFCQKNARKMSKFIISNVDLNFNLPIIDKFLNERMVTKIISDKDETQYLLLKIKRTETKKYRKHTIIRRIVDKVNPYFKWVYRAQFDKYPPNTKFAITSEHDKGEEIKFKTLYFINSRCIKEDDDKLPKTRKRKLAGFSHKVKKLRLNNEE